MIEAGMLVGAGLLVTLFKMNWRWRMHLLSNPVWVDTIILMGMILIHWGTFSGVMAATIGAMTCSLVLSGARAIYGHIEKGEYQPGYFNMGHKL